MENSQIDNKRIAKNTLMLYCRMGVMMLVSLYTSRVVLATLGVEDYGIYNVVGGFVAMMGFLNSAMTTSTQRYLTFELGRGDMKKLKKVFSTSINLHLIVSILVVLIGETIGLWFLYNKMVIPPERTQATFWVFQLSLATFAISIMSSPYNAAIIAHERMSAFAYISILEGLLKLLIVFLLSLVQWDKLILYASLMAMVQVLIRFVYSQYCTKRFMETRYSFCYDRTLFREMFSFSCWDLYGNASVMIRTQGVNMLLNMFFTVTMNAASAIATQVQSAIGVFASNILQAFRPQIVKTFATDNYKEMTSLIIKSSQYTTMLLLLLTIPLYVEIDYILELWLENVPNYTGILSKYTLLFNIFANLSTCVVSGLHAAGKIKRPSFINGTLYMMVLPIAYFFYKMGGKPEIAYLYNVLTVFIGMILNVFTLHHFVSDFKKWKYIKEVLGKCSIIAFVLLGLSLFIQHIIHEGLFRFLITMLINAVMITISIFCVIMKDGERRELIMRLKGKCYF